MAKPQNATITVFDAERYDGEWMPDNLAGAVAWLAAKLREVPPKYRDTATIRIDSNSGYEGSHYAHIEIEYVRPETPEEAAEREGVWERRRQEEIAHLKMQARRLGIELP